MLEMPDINSEFVRSMMVLSSGQLRLCRGGVQTLIQSAIPTLDLVLLQTCIVVLPWDRCQRWRGDGFAERPLRRCQRIRDPGSSSRGRRATPNQSAPEVEPEVELDRPRPAQRVAPAATDRSAPAAARFTPNTAALARPTGRPPLDLSATTTGVDHARWIGSSGLGISVSY